jgi:hypothetical protein
MYVIGVSQSELNEIAAKTGVTIRNTRLGPKKDAVSFKIVPITAKYRRVNIQGRKIQAVCFHGHAAFMYEIFQRYPGAEIGTGEAIYRGRSDFNANAVNSGSKWVTKDVQYWDLCECKDS